jgi:hypothetical protein
MISCTTTKEFILRDKNNYVVTRWRLFGIVVFKRSVEWSVWDWFAPKIKQH